MSDNSFKKKMPSLKTMSEAYDILFLKAKELMEIEKENLYNLINWDNYDEYKFHDEDIFISLHYNEDEAYSRQVMGINLDKHFIIEDNANWRSYDDQCVYVIEDIFSIICSLQYEIEYINKQSSFFK